ncbi:MAG TPA: MFS transporter [Anaerolineaceae bacterium]|nr:MFS transporter [Anaerolineaceae bacterium]
MTAEQSASVETFQADRVATIAGAHAVHDTFLGFLPPILPLLIANFNLAKTEAGLLSVFVNAPSLIQPFIGYLGDRIVLRWVVILGPGVSAALMSLLGIAPTYVLVAFLLLLAGLSSAAFHATGPVMAGNLSGGRLGRGMSFWMVGGELGRMLGPVIIVSSIELLTFQGTLWLALAGVATSTVLFVLLRNVPARAPNARPTLPLRQALERMRPILPFLTGVIVLRAFLVTGISTYLPIFMTEEGANLWFAGASLSLMEGAGVAGALLGGSISDRTGRRPVLVTSLLTAPLCLFLLLGARGFVQIPVLLLLGFFMLSTAPVIMAIVQESVPENRALANGIYMAISFVSMSVAALAVGALADHFGMRTAFAVSAALSLGSIPFVFGLTRKRRD